MVDADVLAASLHIRGGDVVDRDTIADVVNEAIEEAHRRRGTAPSTRWDDAAMAADLLLEHIANTCSMRAGDQHNIT